jgi:gliding motility-associated protein GldL
MSKKKGFLDSALWKNFMKYAYGLGAAVVILGALFKIMHWPFANMMLIIGMSVEVFIFAVSAFEPLHAEIDWSRVYPQLAEDFDADFNFDQENQEEMSPEQALLMAEENMKQVELTPDLFTSLSGSLNGLKENVSKLANIEDATVATNEYATRVREASGKVAELNSGYNNTVDAMQGLAANVSSAAGDAKAYQEQVQLVTRNLFFAQCCL